MNKKNTKKDNVIDFPNKLSSIEKEIEAIVFAAAEPLDIETIENKISKKTNVEKILLKLQNEYSNRGINLVCISKKWSFRTSPKLSEIMKQEKTVEKKLSRAAIETLAIIAYKQPINRFNIESVRGVDCSGVIKTLLSKNLIKIKGRDDSPGRPLLYSTTSSFLENFGLNRISDLPKLKEIAELTDQNMLEKIKLDSLPLNQLENSEDVSNNNVTSTSSLQS